MMAGGARVSRPECAKNAAAVNRRQPGTNSAFAVARFHASKGGSGTRNNYLRGKDAKELAAWVRAGNRRSPQRRAFPFRTSAPFPELRTLLYIDSVLRLSNS